MKGTTMQTIQLNPRLWATKAVRTPDGEIRRQGETFEVTDEEWEEMQSRKTQQFSKRYQTFVLAGDVSEGERTQVRVHELPNLTVSQLRSIASDRGLKTGGIKATLVGRIAADAEGEDFEEPDDD